MGPLNGIMDNVINRLIFPKIVIVVLWLITISVIKFMVIDKLRMNFSLMCVWVNYTLIIIDWIWYVSDVVIP